MSGKISQWTLLTILLIATLVYNLQIHEHRDEPTIRTLTATKELVATISGDPEYTIDTALITFHSIARLLRLSPSIMSGRYAHFNQRQNDQIRKLTIEYARSIPETLTSLGAIKNTETVTLKIKRREPVIVTELLHTGPYANIPQAIEKMLQFIDDQGYQATGAYEEVYLVFERIERDPEKFKTLLRLRVEPNQPRN